MTPASTEPAVTPASLRMAASILVLRDDPLEVLMLRRHAGATFPSAMVFPGGVVETEDGSDEWLDLVTGHEGFSPVERALRIGAIRETWEEASILVAHDGSGTLPLASGGSFLEAVRASGCRLTLDKLEYFGHWITPEALPKRFDTWFFLASMPHDQVAHFDGDEMVSVEWLTPLLALERAEAGDRMLFPTRLNLKRLAESEGVTAAFAAASGYPPFTVLPVLERREDGSVLRIPAEAGYGVTEGFQSRD
jgi:8-oxo-dGTP pyrophosphatase MutT (NUDIX family)